MATPSKVGSDANAAKNFGGRGDFGVAESGSERDRAYVSREIKANDRGGAAEHSGVDEERVTGVGGNNSGPGSSSGGDVDTDMSVMDPVSQSGPDDRTDGADMISSDESVSDRFAGKQPNPKLATNSSRANAGKPREHKEGDFVDRTGGDAQTTQSGQGAGAVTNPTARNDDSFESEISIGEASGEDNSPSDYRG